MKNLFNLIGFQVSWWLCILGTNYQFPYIGPLSMLVFLLIHFLYYRVDKKELILILLVLLIGTLIDTLFAYSGMIDYKGVYSSSILLAPLWITAMWAGFASTVNHSMAWLKEKPLITFLMGLFAGPLAYFTAEKFGIIRINGPTIICTAALAIIWGFSLRFIFILNKNLKIPDNLKKKNK